MDDRVDQAGHLMDAFAARTGIDADGTTADRYLWTDAFAVCNFLALARRTSNRAHLDRALHLIEQVHRVLGTHRPDDARSGWISGLSETQGQLHPTRGGLRIGKPLNERRPGEPLDDQLEWERDGQYFHYLTKWMHALHRASLVTGDHRYLDWALELAAVASRAFAYQARSGARRMYWKMSIELSRPQVPSMGAMDPLDGFTTFCTLLGAQPDSAMADLHAAIDDMHRMSSDAELATSDALGIGGMLCDAGLLTRLIARGNLAHTRLLDRVLTEIHDSLRSFMMYNPLEAPADRRLPFRELGLAIGLHALDGIQESIVKNRQRFPDSKALLGLLEAIDRLTPLTDRIEQFWLTSDNQSSSTWTDHENINAVMLATSLVPEVFLMSVRFANGIERPALQ